MVTSKPPANQSSLSDGCAWAAIIGVIAIILLAIGKCSGATSDNTAATDAYNATNAEMSRAIAAQTPPAPEPLNATSINRGISQLRAAVAVEGFPGAMIYSQNCYDALAREFTWARLDQCGAADMLATRSLPDADSAGLENEMSYFQSEEAARRYLAAATGAREAAAEADIRWSQIQTRVAQTRAVGRRPTATNDDTSFNAGDAVNGVLDAPMDETAGE